MENTARPRRRRRRWIIAAAVVLGIVGVGVAALPWFLSTAPARRWLLARANRTLAPGGLDVATFRFSWFGPTVMTGFALRDPQGDRVVFAPRAVWDRNLGHILFDRPRYGVLRLDGATLDVERLPDGTVDLYEALRPILGPNLRDDWTIRVVDGSLRLRSPGLARPVAARPMDLVIRRPSAPRPLTWQLHLVDGPRPDAPTLDVDGQFNRWKHGLDRPAEVDVTLNGRRWPVATEIAGLTAELRYDGRSEFQRRDGLWSLSGAATLHDLDVTAPSFRGDRLRVDGLAGRWRVSQTDRAWTLRELDLKSALATLQATGEASGATRLEGTLDLVAIARQLPRALRLREGLGVDQGSARLVMSVADGPEGPVGTVEATVSDLVAHDGDRVIRWSEPATLSAHWTRRDDEFRLNEFGLTTSFLQAQGQGDPDAGIKVAGTIDLDGLRRQARQWVDPADIPIAGQGRFDADYRRAGTTFAASLKADLDDLRLAGLERDALHLQVTLDGPADEAGLPRGWTSSGLTLTSGEACAQLAATPEGKAIALRGDLASPLTLGERPGRFAARAVARWVDQSLTIDEVATTIQPDDPDSRAAGTVALAIRGRFDAATRELVLVPSDARGDVAVSLAPEGLRLTGLGVDAWRGELGLTGDVAALRSVIAAWSGTIPPELRGTWASRWSWRGGDGLQFGGRVEVRDGGGPIALDVRGVYRDQSDALELAELVVNSPYASVEASGRVEELSGRRLADLRGRITPDWARLDAHAKERVEPGARIEGGPGTIVVTGPLETPDATLALELAGADFYGMRLGAATIGVIVEQGMPIIEPIETSLNGGRLRLVPEVSQTPDGTWSLRLAEGTAIEDAEINEEVSHRVLAFVAPVLDNATSVRGRVSARVERAEFPLVADVGRKAVVEGRVVFQDVAFAPGTLSRQLLDLLGRGDRVLKLDEPVVLSIADGRVYQRGFALPLGNLTRIELSGSVGFDRTLDLTASLPLTSTMVADRELLAMIVAGTRIRVPIGGTLSRPRVDREAFRVALADLGKTLLRRSAVVGATELLLRLARPRAPEAALPPPRLTPEQRKARRIEKKAQRQRGRSEP